MPVRAILFDKDGTLLDFERTWGPAVYEIIYTLAEGNAVHMQGLADVSHFDLLSKRFRNTSPLIAGTNAEYGPAWAAVLGVAADDAFIRRMDDLALSFGEKHAAGFDGIDALLDALRADGIKLGVATNDAEASARAQLATIGIDRHFDYVAGYDSGHGSKPAPGMVQAFCHATGVAPGETMMIGDSLHDLHAARAAGAIAVGVASGFVHADDLARHADLVIARLDELRQQLARF